MRDLLTAFGVVFVAELGDKTQLAAAAFASRHRAGAVAIGVTIAYVIVSTASVAVGAAAGAAFPTTAVNVGSAVVFIVIGLATLRADSDDDAPSTTTDRRGTLALIGSVVLAITLAELGDKTMLATVSLAAGASAIPTWVGATAGITSAGLLGVVFGDWLARRFSPRLIRLVSGWLFVAIGAGVLLSTLR